MDGVVLNSLFDSDGEYQGPERFCACGCQRILDESRRPQAEYYSPSCRARAARRRASTLTRNRTVRFYGLAEGDGQGKPQWLLIVERLRLGPATHLELLQASGSMSVTRRLSDCRDYGYEIACDKESGTHPVYRLVKEK